MKRLSPEIIAKFGSIQAISDLVHAPHSTVKAWRSRISDSRLHHLRLASMAAGLEIPWDTLEDADPLPDKKEAA
jgi:hypothetical protein